MINTTYASMMHKYFYI